MYSIGGGGVYADTFAYIVLDERCGTLLKLPDIYIYIQRIREEYEDALHA